MYQRDDDPHARQRTEALISYGTGCLELAACAAGDLTPTGTLIAQRLKEAF